MCDSNVCNSKRIFLISAKSSDCNICIFNGKERDGYAPLVNNVCSGDYVDISVCLDCGKVQGKFPVEDPEI